jgi:hypothetical protein
MPYMRFALRAAQLLIVSSLSVTIARAEGGRVRVAILDGGPVYHWAVFKSVYRDDIDRALILRDFRRQGKTLAEHFVDEAIEIVTAKDFSGDRRTLMEALKREGETFADFRQFIAEEVILQAMRRRETQQGKKGRPPRSEAKWLLSLRKGARIQILELSDREDNEQKDARLRKPFDF